MYGFFGLMMGEEGDYEPPVAKCEMCQYQLLNGWCSNCDMAQHVQLRDHAFTCRFCQADIYSRSIGFVTEHDVADCPRHKGNHEPDEEELEWFAQQQEAAYEPPAAPAGPDEHSVGYKGEWGLEEA